ncbi:MAG: hypothetical protein K1X88_28460 [Nannocystaceae bacterium]|nr:hypothetical protein [Nannocystaceae bacterium]
MELSVGKDIFAVCGKCGDTWHVIVALEGTKVTKVQCKFCQGYHRFKRSPNDPAAATAPAPTRAVAPTRSASGAKKSASRKPAAPRRAEEPLIDPNLDLPVRDYAMSETYQTGERIEHPKFGQGVVESFPSPGKMNVFFEDGRRTLAYGRAVAQA